MSFSFSQSGGKQRVTLPYLLLWMFIPTVHSYSVGQEISYCYGTQMFITAIQKPKSGFCL